jgi:hypothetical protein
LRNAAGGTLIRVSARDEIERVGADDCLSEVVAVAPAANQAKSQRFGLNHRVLLFKR